MSEPVQAPRRTLPPVPPAGRRPVPVDPGPSDTGRHAAVDGSDDDTSLALPPLDSWTDSGRHADLTQQLEAAVETGGWRAMVATSAVGARGSWSTDSWSTGTGAVSETGRHAAYDTADDHAETDPDHDDELSSTGPHRVLVTRPSHRRWVSAGVGAAVLAIVTAAVLSSGFAPGEAASAGTDEAARTEAATTSAPATTSEAPLPTPAMSTIDISPGTPGGGSNQQPPSSNRTSPSSSTTRPGPAPQASTASEIAVAPPVTTITDTGTGTGTGTGGSVDTAPEPITPTSPPVAPVSEPTPPTCSPDPCA